MTYPAAKDVTTAAESVRIYKQLMKTKTPRKKIYPYLFRALKLEPKHPEANFLKGKAILDYHYVQWPEAIEYFEIVISSRWKRRLVWALTLKASVLVNLDRFVEAEWALAQALTAARNQGMYLKALYGNRLFVRLIKEILRTGIPKKLEEPQFVAFSMSFSDDENAVTAADYLTSKYNEFLDLEKQGDLALEKKDLKKASEYFDKALSIARGNTVYRNGFEVYCKQFEVLRALKEYKKAEKVTLTMIANFHYYKTAWALRGVAMFNFKQYESALENFDKAIELGDERIAVWGNKVSTLIELKRYPEAIEAINHILKIQPENKQAKRMKEILKDTLR